LRKMLLNARDAEQAVRGRQASKNLWACSCANVGALIFLPAD
jgi:hypothetical protein